MENPGFYFLQGPDFFYRFQSVETGSWGSLSPYQMAATGILSSETKWLEHEVDPASPPSAHECSYTCVPAIRLHGADRHKLYIIPYFLTP
jgi:hypothetical protein